MAPFSLTAGVGSYLGSYTKRLVRYALSRLELLDLDDYALENLASTGVGLRSTTDLRDVPLRVNKLASQLELPPNLVLESAQILHIRVIADIVTSRILVEINGVRVVASLRPGNAKEAPSFEKPSDPESGGGAVRSGRRASRAGPSHGQDRSPEHDHIPSTRELAESFLAEQPVEEKRKLEEALISHPKALEASSTLSEDEVESEEGTGVFPSVPEFLNSRLKLIKDQLEVTVNDVDIRLDAEVSTENKAIPGKGDENTSVSLNFRVESLSIDSLMPSTEEAGTPVSHADQSRKGKRRISLHNIFARLISEAPTPFQLSRRMRSRPPSPLRKTSLSPRSGSETHERSSTTQRGNPRKHSTAAPSISHSSSSVRSSTARSKDSRPKKQSAATPPAMESSTITDDGDRFADAGDIESGSAPASLVNDSSTRSSLGSETPIGGHANQFLATSNPQEDAPWDSRFLDDEDMSTSAIQEALSRNLEASSETVNSNQQQSSETHPMIHPADMSQTFSDADDTDAEEHETARSGAETMLRSRPSTRSTLPSEQASSPSSLTQSPASSDGEDLSESKLYSHEYAQSMYMSAMSGAQSTASEAFNVPGGWADDSDGSNLLTSRPSSSPSKIPPPTAPPDVRHSEDGCETPRPGSRDQERSVPETEHATDFSAARYFLGIDSVSFWLSDTSPPADTARNFSSQDRDTPATTVPTLDESSHDDMPGAFSWSQYAEASALQTKRISFSPRPNQPRQTTAKKQEIPQPEAPPSTRSAGLDIEVGSIQSFVDASTGWLLYQLIQQLLSTLGGPPSTPNQQQAPTSSLEYAHSFSVSDLSVALVEHLASIPAKRHSTEVAERALAANSDAVLLEALFMGLQVDASTAASLSSLNLKLRKFSFGFPDEDVLSFLPSSARGQSRKDRDGHSSEVSLAYFVLDGQPRLRVNTPQLRVSLDVQRLDDTLSQFGGFSGILELGSSIASNGTMRPPSPKPPRQRGVHFDHPLPPPPSSSSSLSVKVDIRLSGITFILKGKTCSISLDADPVKVAWRKYGLRAFISSSTFTGPHNDEEPEEDTLGVDLSDIQVEYLFTPEESDLTRLLALITPSKDKYENDDDILVETLLRQRRKGSVLRATVSDALLRIPDLTSIERFKCLGKELARLSTVAKYLPEDDRPGILTFLLIKSFESRVFVNEKLGSVDTDCQSIQLAHIGIPSLIAGEIRTMAVRRGEEELIREVLPQRAVDHLPMLMARMIGDEMVPTLKMKFFNLCVEYRVPTITALLDLEDATVQNAALSLADSMATIMDNQSPGQLSRQSSDSSESSSTMKQLHVDVLLRDCAIGLNPQEKASKGLFALTDTHFAGVMPGKDDVTATLEIRTAFLLVIDDHERIGSELKGSTTSTHSALGSRQVIDLCRSGYVSLSEIKSARADVTVKTLPKDDIKAIEVNFKDDLIVLEACADSLQTLIGVMNGLKPPISPSKGTKYRTNMPFQNMMESFTGNAFAMPDDTEQVDTVPDALGLSMDEADTIEDELPTNLEYVGSFYNPESMPSPEETADSMLEDDLSRLANPTSTKKIGQKRLLESFQEQYEVAENPEPLDFQEDYFGAESPAQENPHRWNSTKNEYDMTADFTPSNCTFQLRIRDVHFIFNMFDGYDWAKTRHEVIDAVDRLEKQAQERRMKSRADDEPEDVVIGDHLFNSIWIEVKPGLQPHDLRRQINRDLNDLVSESGSYATTTASTAQTVTAAKPKRKEKGYHFGRSRHHKMTIELSGVSADMFVFPPGSGETESSIDVRIRDLEIFDHVPTSTWKKFATYMHDAGERETGRPMVHVELLIVKPVEGLEASELVLKVSVLPLRLHVDQDALDFMTRFFEFSDAPQKQPDLTSSLMAASEPFLQRVEVNTVQVKLDYKPKKVDYSGIRSGHTTEFMNFFILDDANITLRHAILYGISGFDRLHKTLNDVWMPDVKRNQLPHVVAGLAAIRPFVNVGSGVKELVVVPMREYRRDGRVVRAIQKGAFAFATRTTSELARLGAKVAIGTQTVLQGAETLLSPTSDTASSITSPTLPSGSSPTDPTGADWDPEFGPEPSPPRAHSNYADQPLTVLAGLRGAARGLERDLLTARDAIIAVGGGVRASDNPGDAVRAVAQGAPTIVLRPAIGATRAVGTALLGAGNQLDRGSGRRVGDKYKRY